MFEPYLYLFL